MIPVERRQIILEMVAEKGIVSIAELTDRMNVSHMTIRRDLQKLEQQGAVVLVSGGVQVLFSREVVSIWMRERPR